jgi:hypothetical protein
MSTPHIARSDAIGPSHSIPQSLRQLSEFPGSHAAYYRPTRRPLLRRQCPPVFEDEQAEVAFLLWGNAGPALAALSLGHGALADTAALHACPSRTSWPDGSCQTNSIESRTVPTLTARSSSAAGFLSRRAGGGWWAMPRLARSSVRSWIHAQATTGQRLGGATVVWGDRLPSEPPMAGSCRIERYADGTVICRWRTIAWSWPPVGRGATWSATITVEAVPLVAHARIAMSDSSSWPPLMRTLLALTLGVGTGSLGTTYATIGALIAQNHRPQYYPTLLGLALELGATPIVDAMLAHLLNGPARACQWGLSAAHRIPTSTLLRGLARSDARTRETLVRLLGVADAGGRPFAWAT